MWVFRPKAPSEKIRDPIQGEFFATEAIDGPAQALIRESIQNSLDAALGTGPVTFRVSLYDSDCAMSAADAAPYFSGAWPHYTAPRNGLSDPPDENSPCPFLLIEDYGTKGLTGDPEQADPHLDPEQKNPFFLFFRAEGLSAKSGADRGRWGIGKFVFPRSSTINTHFGVTVRHDDGRRLLLGAATLKAHRIAGDEKLYTPDGLFGRATQHSFVLPVEAEAAVDQFCCRFRVTRQDEPGLSVVIPFVDPAINSGELLKGAVNEYFWAVLSGRLVIDINHNSNELLLDASSIEAIAKTHASQVGPDAVKCIELAKIALSINDEQRIVIGMPAPQRAAKWTDDLLSAEQITSINAALAAGSSIAIRAPVTVRSKRRGDETSFFDMYIRPDIDPVSRPVLMREGLVISDARPRRVKGYRALVVVENGPLGTMLGDAENPAHTQWQKDSSNFKGKYTYGKALIEYVTDCVSAVMGIINRSSEKADPSLTVDAFSITIDDPPEQTPAPGRHRTQNPGPETQIPEVPVAKKLARFRITQLTGGFAVCSGEAPLPRGALIEVACAYDIRSGNPLKKWHHADFTMNSAEIAIQGEGEVRVIGKHENRFTIAVFGSDFRVSVTGFDQYRDVYVKADVKEAADGAETI